MRLLRLGFLTLGILAVFSRGCGTPALVNAQERSCKLRWSAIANAGDRAWRLAPFRKRNAILDFEGTAFAAAAEAARDPHGPLCAEPRLAAAEAVLTMWKAKGWLLTEDEMNQLYARKAAEDVDAAIKKAAKEK